MILSTGCGQKPIEIEAAETLPTMSQMSKTSTIMSTSQTKMETIVRLAATTAETTVPPTTTVELATDIVSSTEPTTEAKKIEKTITETAVPTQEKTKATEPPTTEAPRPAYTFTDMTGRSMYVQNSVNIRTLPSIDGDVVTTRERDDEVWVTGQCNETGWYRIDIEGHTFYISNGYVAEARYVEPTTAAPVRSTPVPQPPSSSGFVYYSISGYKPNYDYEKYLYECLVDRGIAWWYPWAVAQIMQESCWNPNSTNGKDHGICQFKGNTFQVRAVHHANLPDADIWNPYHSLYVYSFYIRDVLVVVNCDIDAALSYYIVGNPGIPHYDYVSRIRAYYNSLRVE